MRQKSNGSDVRLAGETDRQVDWEAEARRILKAELARAGMSYKALVKRLEAMGIEDNESAIANRISRGKFSLAFFLQCLQAIGVRTVDVSDRSK
jgi:hypothetical protein